MPPLRKLLSEGLQIQSRWRTAILWCHLLPVIACNKDTAVWQYGIRVAHALQLLSTDNESGFLTVSGLITESDRSVSRGRPPDAFCAMFK
jgi:hypothetical protein